MQEIIRIIRKSAYLCTINNKQQTKERKKRETAKKIR